MADNKKIIGVIAGVGLALMVALKAKAAPAVPTCSYCGATFSTLEELNAHITEGHTCSYCGNTFRTEAQRDAHIVSVHTCPLCGATFFTKAERDAHVTEVHTCPLCGATFLTQGERDAHVTEVHTCPLCGATFPTKAKVDAHVISAHTCPYCGQVFLTSADRNVHVESIHTCPYCGATFTTKAQVNAHISAVHTCSYCGATFATKAERDAHVAAAHHFECPVCHLVFTSQELLNAHIAESHPSENIGYVYGAVLNSETRAGIVGASINIGGYSVISTTGGGYLMTGFEPGIQVRVSVALEHYCPYEATVIPLATGTTFDILLVANRVCPVCGADYCSPDDLLLHEMASHFMCSYCPLVFATQSALLAHLSSMHKPTGMVWGTVYIWSKFDNRYFAGYILPGQPLPLVEIDGLSLYCGVWGDFTFRNMIDNTQYTLTVSYPGYVTQRRTFDLTTGNWSEQNFYLDPL